MKHLKLSPDLVLPLEAATRRMAILGMSGSGKSNLAVLLAELMFQAGIPWVAIDPKGDWWGVRSNENGRGPGLPIPIFGGLHGDLPLEPTAGALVAETIIEQGLTCVLDVSEFNTNQDRFRFLAEFGETLLKRDRHVLHLFLEEADEYLPQRLNEKGYGPRCLGVWQRIVKRGRFRGLGTSQITQRSASLNKDTLYQAEALFAMRTAGEGDIRAVRGWVQHHNAADEIVDSLPTLADGEGWMSSPAWLRVTKRARFLRRGTFDSGATPVLLKARAKSVTLADVDLDAMRTKMAATIDRVYADDPGKLKTEIGRLQKELAATKKQPVPAPQIQRVEVPIITDKQILALQRACDGAVISVVKNTAAVETAVQKMSAVAQGVMSAARAVRTAPTPSTPRQATTAQTSRAPARGQLPGSGLPPRREAPTGMPLSKGERAVLTVCAQYPAGVYRDQITVLTGYKKSSRDTYLQRLGVNGYVVMDNGRICATRAGVDALGPDFEPLPTGKALQEYWLGRLTGGEKTILATLIQRWPAAVSRDELSGVTGYKKSSRDTYLQRLVSRRLANADRIGVYAREELFNE